MSEGRTEAEQEVEAGSGRELSQVGGWLRLYRKLRESARYKRSEYVHLWIHCLLSAEFKERRAVCNGQQVVLRPGQFVSSRAKMAEETGISEGTVARVLNLLKIDQQIDQQGGNKSSMFTVLNWHLYQKGDQQTDQQAISKRSAKLRKPKQACTDLTLRSLRSKEGGEEDFEVSDSERVVWSKELERVEKEMADIRGSYDAHQSWSGDDRVRHRGLRLKRDEIRGRLGL